MFSVAPDPELIGPREHPVTVPQAMGIPQAFADLVRVVPFNDLAEAERAFAENEGRVAGMIVEPAMMNCGVVLPQPGYLQGSARPLPSPRGLPRVRRGEDRRRRSRGEAPWRRSASSPTS